MKTMSIQPDKAVWMLASRTHIDRWKLHLWYSPKQVPQETSGIYLGITLDTKMTRNTHMEAIRTVQSHEANEAGLWPPHWSVCTPEGNRYIAADGERGWKKDGRFVAEGLGKAYHQLHPWLAIGTLTRNPYKTVGLLSQQNAMVRKNIMTQSSEEFIYSKSRKEYNDNLNILFF